MTDDRVRVAVLDDYEGVAATVPQYEALTERAEVTIFREWLGPAESVTQAVEDYDILLLMRERTRFNEAMYARLPKLRFIAQTGRTSGHLDMPAATKHGIPVAGTPSDNGAATKELTIGLILALLRKIPEVSNRMRDERWPAVAGNTLEGKTVGVLGLGRIGTEVARILKLFDTRVLAYSPSLTPERAAEVGAECVPMETLLNESDILTLHVQLNPQTRGLLGRNELGLMKRGALLVNTGRAALVDEQAMIEALKTGQLGGVGLDVFWEEPLPLDHPIRRFENVVLTPHRGYGTVEILAGRYEHAFQNVLDFLDGKPPKLFNPEVRTNNP